MSSPLRNKVQLINQSISLQPQHHPRRHEQRLCGLQATVAAESLPSYDTTKGKERIRSNRTGEEQRQVPTPNTLAPSQVDWNASFRQRIKFSSSPIAPISCGDYKLSARPWVTTVALWLVQTGAVGYNLNDMPALRSCDPEVDATDARNKCVQKDKAFREVLAFETENVWAWPWFRFIPKQSERRSLILHSMLCCSE